MPRKTLYLIIGLILLTAVLFYLAFTSNVSAHYGKITPVPTPTPTVKPCFIFNGRLPIPYPCPTVTPAITITPTPSATPSATPTATPSATTTSTPSTGSGQANNPPVCSDGVTILLPGNPFVIRKGTQATVNFFITQGDSANIYVRVTGQGDWNNAVTSVRDIHPNSDKFVSVTINDLDANTGYDFGIQQKYGCGGGQLVTAVVVDGPQAKIFNFSYWQWSK